MTQSLVSREMMAVMESDQAPGRPPRAGPPHPDDRPAAPVKSQDDSDVGWGEQPGPDDDERLQRDRPPHWDSA
jgi:hypothetical protein